MPPFSAPPIFGACGDCSHLFGRDVAFYGEFQTVLAKHSKSFNLIDTLSVGVDRQSAGPPLAEGIVLLHLLDSRPQGYEQSVIRKNARLLCPD
jgi:hypothetical protein